MQLGVNTPTAPVANTQAGLNGQTQMPVARPNTYTYIQPTPVPIQNVFQRLRAQQQTQVQPPATTANAGGVGGGMGAYTSPQIAVQSEAEHTPVEMTDTYNTPEGETGTFTDTNTDTYTGENVDGYTDTNGVGGGGEQMYVDGNTDVSADMPMGGGDAYTDGITDTNTDTYTDTYTDMYANTNTEEPTAGGDV
eukprot:GDKI01039176.1.p1 GENE.GDKI01039176.1~~GDKI01039176.1.p1  ORF type:complete len:193 (-),score=74.08 GDKI01039176.1:16-594(-)